MKAIASFLIIGFFFFCTPSVHASLFDELSGDQQQAVLQKLKGHLPGMIESDSGLKGYADAMVTHIPDLATSLGALSGGYYDPIITQSLTFGVDSIASAWAGTFDEGLGQDTFKYIYSKKSSVKNVALAMMDEKNNWGDVKDVVWVEIKSNLRDDLNAFAADAAKGAFNWVIGGGKTLGFTPADLYILAIQAEMIFIDVETRRYKEKTFHEIYSPYYEARESGANPYSAWETIIYDKKANTTGWRTTFVLGDMPDSDIKALFEKCYNSGIYNDNLYQFMKYSLEKDIQKKQADLAKNLEKSGSKFKNDLNGFYDKVKGKLNELVGEEVEKITKQRDEEIENDKELKKRYEAALEKAGILLDKIEIDDDKRQPSCESYAKQQERKNDATRSKNENEWAIDDLEKNLNNLEQCQEINTESQSINNDLDKLKALLNKSAQSWEELKQAVTEVCAEASLVSKSREKSKARQALNNAIKLGKSAEQLVRSKRQLEQDIAEQLGSLSFRISRFDKKYRGKGSNVKENLEEKLHEAREAFDLITKWEKAEKQYQDAEKRMESNRTKAVNLSLSIDKNYIEINDILNEGGLSDSLFSLFSSESSTFKWGSKGQSLLTKARKRQQHLASCDEVIQLLVTQEREQLRGRHSLTHTIQELFPDILDSSTSRSKNDEEEDDEWTLSDTQDLKKRYKRASAKCNYTKNAVDSIAMLTDLSELQKKQTDITYIDLYQGKINTCIAAALAAFDRKFLDKEESGEEQDASNKPDKKQEAEKYCKERLPGSVPAVDNKGNLLLSTTASFRCKCPGDAIKYNNKCVRCSVLKQNFDNAIRAKRTENALEILKESFHCDWVQKRNDKTSLTEREICPDMNTVYLLDEDDNAQCVPCSQLEVDFENALDENNYEYANTLASLAAQCSWSSNAEDKISQDKAQKQCKQSLPGSVVVRSRGVETCRCPAGTVKLSDQNNHNACVSCSDLERDFNAILAEGDLEYAETILEFADGCGYWVTNGWSKLKKVKGCPPGSIKLSDEHGNNQCVSCETLKQDFQATLSQGDFLYAEELLDLSSDCGWVGYGKEALRNAQKCPQNTVKLSDGSGSNQCVPCDTLYADYKVARGQGDHQYADSLLDLASECGWSKQAAQQIGQAQLQAELNQKCNQQMQGSHAVINGDRYNCYCDEGMLEITYGNGTKVCKSCEQIRLMVNDALRKNDANTVRGLIQGARHCDWYDQAAGIVAGMTNNRPSRQPQSQPSQKQGPLTGSWDMYWKEFNPTYWKSMDGSKTRFLNFDGHKGVVKLTHENNSLRGQFDVTSGNGQSIMVDGSVNGSQVNFCIFTSQERDCTALTVDYNTMTMTGVNVSKSGRKRIKWTLRKRR
ncbi:hypothetical protein [Desulfogranum marinum]|uniref:hypothetical protein n=1 Tax=Desulfogranum marinum TaxID=453220 RepID=UPI00196699A6|nr:hypothetical protein [Desulfogranum marinum]MBM9512814.1 hypothetical protein [Desulfogranum marinum]